MSKINVSAAIEKTGKVRATICRWIDVYRIGDSKIGHMSGGHYMVDEEKLDMIVEGRQKQLFEILIKEAIESISKKGIPVITVRGKTIWLNTVGGLDADIPLTPLRYERRHIQYEEVMFLISQEGFLPKGSDGTSLIYMRNEEYKPSNSKQQNWNY
jgi:hypothetical protein